MGTVGAEKVRKFLANHTQKDLAERISRRLGRKVYQATVSAYALGKFIPRGPIMVALREIVGADFDDWERAVKQKVKPLRKTKAA